MKNAAVKAMIAKQFNHVELSDINVIFDIAIGGKEEYIIYLMDDGVYKQFKVTVEMSEIK